MVFTDYRHELAAKAANKAASAGGSRFQSFQNSTFASTVLAPVLANRFPYIITPYLGLRARLSQIWINRWTILLLLVLVRTMIAIANFHEDINSARREALSACGGIESMGSAMASMPHYMSQGVNALTADGIDRAVHALMSMLLMTVTGVEEIVLFVINMLTSTYVCLITLVVRGAIESAIELIKGVEGFLNQTIGTIGQDIHHTVSDFQSAYNDFINGLDDVGHLLGAGSIPKLDISGDLKKLDDLQLPPDLNSDLNDLMSKVPTFSEVQDFTNNAISWPFEQVKKLISESQPNYKFDRSLLPVPAKQTMTFCSDNNGIDDFFSHLQELNEEGRKIVIAVLLILAVLVCGPMAWREVRSYRKMQERSETLRSGSKAPLDSVYIVSRPYTADAGLKAASLFEAPRRQSLVRWAIAYATTVPALFVLSLGIAGLFSCLCRYLLLLAVEHEVPDLVNEVSGFAGKVVDSLNNASASWAHETNHVILDMNNKINEDMFGWVNKSTHAVNHTLNVFVDGSIDVIRDAFGGTVLYKPVKELFKCLIGLKVDSIEKGLTWVHQHAHIDFPLLPNDTFSIGAAASVSGSPDASSFLADPSGGTTDQITSIVNTLAERYAESIRNEAIISACVVGVWVVVALMGIGRAIWLFYGKGHMPEDYGFNGNDEPRWGEKSPSFVGTGEYFGSPNLQQGNPEKASVPNVVVQPPSSHSSGAGETPVRNYSKAANGSNAANQYKGQTYTITPRPFPKFNGSTQPPASPSNLSSEKADLHAIPSKHPAEDLGYAGQRSVQSSTKNSHGAIRSEYGAFGRTTGDGTRGRNLGVTFGAMGH